MKTQDILYRLSHSDKGVWDSVRAIESHMLNIEQTLSMAHDEIRRFRVESEKLRRINRKLARRIK